MSYFDEDEISDDTDHDDEITEEEKREQEDDDRENLCPIYKDPDTNRCDQECPRYGTCDI